MIGFLNLLPLPSFIVVIPSSSMISFRYNIGCKMKFIRNCHLLLLLLFPCLNASDMHNPPWDDDNMLLLQEASFSSVPSSSSPLYNCHQTSLVVETDNIIPSHDAYNSEPCSLVFNSVYQNQVHIPILLLPPFLLPLLFFL